MNDYTQCNAFKAIGWETTANSQTEFKTGGVRTFFWTRSLKQPESSAKVIANNNTEKHTVEKLSEAVQRMLS